MILVLCYWYSFQKVFPVLLNSRLFLTFSSIRVRVSGVTMMSSIQSYILCIVIDMNLSVFVSMQSPSLTSASSWYCLFYSGYFWILCKKIKLGVHRCVNLSESSIWFHLYVCFYINSMLFLKKNYCSSVKRLEIWAVRPPVVLSLYKI